MGPVASVPDHLRYPYRCTSDETSTEPYGAPLIGGVSRPRRTMSL